MEILVAVVITVLATLGLILFTAGAFILFRMNKSLEMAHENLKNVCTFLESVSNSVVDAQMCISEKKRALGLDREGYDENIQ